ncbi:MULTISPECIES: DUF3106 domain-containing protein [unclassified Undibacterium]|uniref:DUF3106 domain-containing protein n=1 Tax=unclassified Undibacterium TaxID=2630295 RepID=UPI002AC95483|nr:MULTISPECIES: DUF3106 domain-containing protein [unclassified Undibacterium]MEB0140045.1 DUF3106 domain-containing protein [Undibacterium sp. CCC2.1]MEB0173042.1 DUF3106 domain-containing protein [Undibacterium sp. CCC1.1]MEB0176854.1 DUF3106 domain-containing protein [Undibacterium sp. CCC3.4]MEB0216086.1 DUF3106 domain-containing protein [Undibacterium sp. 5I2]WPX42030.1 DUF3106 domain-containing protein [Undibacterium sp. CCC3.4]
MLSLRHYLLSFLIACCMPALALANGATSATPAATPVTAAGKPAQLAALNTKPAWGDLSMQQRATLAPLVGEWPRMSEFSKKKWLEIATRAVQMKPDEQARLQERMRDWVKLSPEQRAAARENFAHANLVKPELKSAQWQQYQQLSEEEKKQLAAEHKKPKNLTNLSVQNIKNPQILAPIKVGPKPAPVAKPLKPVVPAGTPAAIPASTSLVSAMP